MNKSKMVKFFSFLLVVSILFCQIIVGFADSIQKNDARLTKIEGKDKVIYDIHEGEFHDIVVIEDSGRMYLNGSLVKVTSDSLGDPGIAPHSTYTGIVNSAPAGTVASDYNKLLGTERKNVELDKYYADNSLLSIATLFAFAFNDATFGIDAWYEVLLEFNDIMNRDFSYTKAMSAEIKTYQHKNGQMITTDTAANKLVVRCYGNGNYTGYLGTDTRYKIWVYR